MKVIEFENKEQSNIITTLENLLADAKEGKVISLMYLYVDDERVYGYGFHGVTDRFQASGQCLGLANTILHDGFMREEG